MISDIFLVVLHRKDGIHGALFFIFLSAFYEILRILNTAITAIIKSLYSVVFSFLKFSTSSDISSHAYLKLWCQDSTNSYHTTTTWKWMY